VSYKGLNFWGFLAYNIRTVRATAPKLCVLIDIMGPHFLHQTDLRKAHSYCPESGKSLWLPIWFPYGRFHSAFACCCQKVV